MVDIFTPNQLALFEQGKAKIKGEALYINSGFGVEGYIKVIGLNGEQEVIRESKTQSKDILMTGTYLTVDYVKKPDELPPTIIDLRIAGKDTCFWAGHYGPTIKFQSLRMVMI